MKVPYSGNFRGRKLSRNAKIGHIMGVAYIQFRGENFRGWRKNREIVSFLPRKFPAIRYKDDIASPVHRSCTNVPWSSFALMSLLSPSLSLPLLSLAAAAAAALSPCRLLSRERTDDLMAPRSSSDSRSLSGSR